MTAAAAALPLPQTRTAGPEHFPVSSWLLPAAIRPKAHAFYRFARAADDIAGDPVMSPEQKLSRLFALDPRPLGPAGATQARRLLAAYKCDSVRNRTANWQDLLDYCALSAVPVGRFLLDLHGEGEPAHDPCDALCVALQLLNLILDLRSDRRKLNRVYLPLDWLSEAGLDAEAMDQTATSPELRRVIDRVLDEADIMLATASRLPRVVRHFRLKLEAVLAVYFAKRLSRKLRRIDPLQAAAEAGQRRRVTGSFLGMLRNAVGA